MTISEFANKVNLSVDIILNICKNLDINVDSSDDLLSEDDIEILYDELENISFSHQGNNNSSNESNITDKSQDSGGGIAPDNNVEIDKESLNNGISKIKTLKDNLDTLKSTLDGITVKSPVDSSLLSNCKHYAAEAINISDSMSDRINKVASLIYDDDEMFGYLFENGLFFDDGKLDIDAIREYLKNENLSQENIENLDDYMKLRDELANKYSNGEFTKRDSDGYLYQDLSKLEQLVIAGGFNMGMFSDFSSGMESYNKQIDGIKNQNKEKDEEAKKIKVDKKSSAFALMSGVNNGDIVEKENGVFYDVSTGNRVILSDDEIAYARYFSNSGQEVKEDSKLATTVKYFDENDNEVIYINDIVHGNKLYDNDVSNYSDLFSGHDVSDEKLSIYFVDSNSDDVVADNCLNNGYELKLYYKYSNLFAGIEVQSMIDELGLDKYKVDSLKDEGVNTYLNSTKVSYTVKYFSESGQEVKEDSRLATTAKYFYENGEEIPDEIVDVITKNDGIIMLSDEAITVKYFSDTGKEVKEDSKLAVTAKYFDKNGNEIDIVNTVTRNEDGTYTIDNLNSYGVVLDNISNQYKEQLKNAVRPENIIIDAYNSGLTGVEWDNKIVGGKYKNDKGEVVYVSGDDFSKLSKSELTSLETFTIDQAAIELGYNDMGDMLSNLGIMSSYDNVVDALQGNIGDYSKIYESHINFMENTYNKEIQKIFDYNKKLKSMVSIIDNSSDFDKIYTQQANYNAKNELVTTVNDVITNGSAGDFARVHISNEEDLKNLFVANSIGLVDINKNGQIYDVESGAWLTLSNDGIDDVLWKQYLNGEVELTSSNEYINSLLSCRNNVQNYINNETRFISNNSDGISGSAAGNAVINISDKEMAGNLYYAAANDLVKRSSEGRVYNDKLGIWVEVVNDGVDITTWNNVVDVLETGDAEKLAAQRSSNAVTNIINKIKGTYFSATELNIDECSNLSDAEKYVSDFKTNFIKKFNSGNNVSTNIFLDEETSKYFLAAYMNGSDEITVNGNTMSFVMGGTTFTLDSEYNCLQNALNELNELNTSDSIMDLINNYDNNYNYLSDLSSVYMASGGTGVFDLVNDKTFLGTLNDRAVSSKKAFAVELANKCPEVASIASVILNPIEGIKNFSYAVDKAFNDDNKSPVYSINTFSYADAMRGQVTFNIQNSGIDDAKGKTLVYSTAMSMADNVFNSFVFGSVGLPMGIGLGLGSFDDSYNDALSRGIGQQDAFIYAGFMAMLEALTEQMSWDNLAKVTGMKWADDVFKNIDVDEAITKSINDNLAKLASNSTSYSSLKGTFGILSQSFSEGFEEVVSSVGGRVIDEFLNKDKSAQNIRYQQLFDNGYSYDDATKIIQMENLDETLQSFLSGMMSGGAMSGGGNILNQSFNSNYQFGNTLEYDLANGDYSSMIEHIMSSEYSSQAKVASANLAINSLYSTGKIGSSTMKQLFDIVNNHNKAKTTVQSKTSDSDLFFGGMSLEGQDIARFTAIKDKASYNTIEINGRNIKIPVYSTIQDNAVALVEAIIKNESFGDDSRRIALISMLQSMKTEGVTISTDQEVLKTLISGIGVSGITREHLLMALNKTDFTMDDVKAYANIDDSTLFNLKDDSQRSVYLSNALKNYLDQFINDAKNQGYGNGKFGLQNNDLVRYMKAYNDKQSGTVVVDENNGKQNTFDELDILGAMQARLDGIEQNIKDKTLDDLKSLYPDIYQEVLESFNRDNSLSNDTNNTNDGESVDLSNIDLLSSFVDGHFKISLVDDMINLEGNDIIYRFSRDNVDSILKKYEGKNLDDNIVREQFESDLKLIENVDIVHKGEVVDSNPKTVVRTGVAGALGAGIISGIENANTGNDGNTASSNFGNGNNRINNGDSRNKLMDKLESSRNYLLSESSLLSNFHRSIKSYYEGKYGNVIQNIEDALNSLMDLSDLDNMQLDNLSMYENRKIIEFLSKIDSENIGGIVSILYDNGILNKIISNIEDKILIKNIFKNISFNDAKTLFKDMSVKNIKYAVINSFDLGVRSKFNTYINLCTKLKIDVTTDSILYFFDNSSSVFLDLYSKKYNNMDMNNQDNVNLFVDDIETILAWTYTSLNEFINNNSLNSLLSNTYFLENVLLKYYGEFSDINDLFSLISYETRKVLILSDNLSDNIKEYLKIELSFNDFINDIKNGKINLGVNEFTLYNGRVISINELVNYIERSNMMSKLFDSMYVNKNYFDNISNMELLYGIVELFKLVDNPAFKLSFDYGSLHKFNDFYTKYLSNKDSTIVKNVLNILTMDASVISTDFSDTIYVGDAKSGVDQHAIANIFDPINLMNPYSIKMSKLLIKQVQDKFPGISSLKAIDFLRRIDSFTFFGGTDGICNYADVANAIFEKFKNNQKLFEQKFGFPMYIDGKLNDAQLLCDMFINISGALIIENKKRSNDEGVISYAYKYLFTETDYINLCNSIGNKDCYRIDLISEYLYNKGIIHDISKVNQYNIIYNMFSDTSWNIIEHRYLVNDSLLKIENALKKGHHISITSASNFELHFDNRFLKNSDFLDKIVKFKFKGAHIMSVYGIENGNILLESWGKRYYVKIQDMLNKQIQFAIDGFTLDGQVLESDAVSILKYSVDDILHDSDLLTKFIMYENNKEFFENVSRQEYIKLFEKYLFEDGNINSLNQRDILNCLYISELREKIISSDMFSEFIEKSINQNSFELLSLLSSVDSNILINNQSFINALLSLDEETLFNRLILDFKYTYLLDNEQIFNKIVLYDDISKYFNNEYVNYLINLSKNMSNISDVRVNEILKCFSGRGFKEYIEILCNGNDNLLNNVDFTGVGIGKSLVNFFDNFSENIKLINDMDKFNFIVTKIIKLADTDSNYYKDVKQYYVNVILDNKIDQYINLINSQSNLSKIQIHDLIATLTDLRVYTNNFNGLSVLYDYINKLLVESNDVIDFEYLEQHIINFSYFFANQNGLEIKFETYYEDNNVGALSHKSESYIIINKKFFKQSEYLKYESIFVSVLDTIFHEITHQIQRINKKNGVVNSYILNDIIESIIIKNGYNAYYKQNYRTISCEIDARHNAKLLLYGYLRKISPDKAFVSYKNMIENGISSESDLNSFYSNYLEIDKKLKLRDILLDEIVYDKIVKGMDSKFLDNNPILKYIYNDDGSRKTILQLLEIRNNSSDQNIIDMINDRINNCSYSLDAMLNEMYDILFNNKFLVPEMNAIIDDLVNFKFIETIIYHFNYFSDLSVNKYDCVAQIDGLFMKLVDKYPNDISNIEILRNLVDSEFEKIYDNSFVMILENAPSNILYDYIMKNSNDMNFVRKVGEYYLSHPIDYRLYEKLILNSDYARYLRENKEYFRRFFLENVKLKYDYIYSDILLRIDKYKIHEYITYEMYEAIPFNKKHRFDRRFSDSVKKIMDEHFKEGSEENDAWVEDEDFGIDEDTIPDLSDVVEEVKRIQNSDDELKFNESKSERNSGFFGNLFGKNRNNGVIVSQQLGHNLFNIDDIRNGKNIVSVDSIKNVDNMSRDELNNILSSNRYNSNQKKSAILSIYLRDMNLSFSTDSVDTIYNHLLYKLSDKNIDSVERNKVLEILRSISFNSNGKYKSIDTLVDYQFKEKSKKDILDTKKRNSEFDLEDFYSSNTGDANGAVIYISDNQVVSMLNDKNGAGPHEEAYQDIISSVYGIDYVRNKRGAIRFGDIGNSILFDAKHSGIQMRLVSEGDSTPQYIVIFPNKISRNQYNLFKAYVDKYGDTLSKISHDLDDKGMIYGVDGLIYCWAANMQGHNLSDLLEYAESLVDDSIKLPTERNIVGETLKDLVSSNDGTSDYNLSYYDDSMFYPGDAYEENFSKNDDNAYELKDGESLREKVGLQFFGGKENIKYLSSDTINSLSIKERQNVENFLGKVISSVTVNEYERYELVVKTADKILENVPEGYFKDDNEKRQFLFGIDTCSDSIGYTASELRDRFNLAKQSGEDLLEIILSDVDDAKGVDVEVLKVYGLYNIVYAMNQFIENSGIKVGDGELPVDKIAAVDPAYYDGAYDQIKSILDGHLQSAETNYKKVTDDLVEIAGLVNGYIKGYDPSSTKQIDHSLKKEPSAIRKVYNDWYSKLEEFGFRIEIVENNADRKLILKGIKKYNIGQSFILTEDGYVKTLDKKEFGTDEKGNIVKVNFSDFIPKDLLRYTIISDISDYVSTFRDTIKMLEDKGYEIIDSNLSWPGSFYRGINLSLRDSETSQIFELQFHTEESFYAKNEGTHSFYEVKRNKKFNYDNKKSPIQKVADYAQILVQSQVDVPVNAEKIGFIKDFVKTILKNKKGIDLSKMNEIIYTINKLNRDYVFGTDEYKLAMREYVESISIDTKFSLSEFLSEYFKIDMVSSIDSGTGVVTLEFLYDIDNSSWVEAEDLGIDEEDGYELKDGESLAGRIGTQFFGGTLNNKDSFNSQLSLFSQLVESVGNNDLFSQILDQIKNLKEIELVGFKTLDEYKSYIIDYFISTNFEGLTPKQFWLLTMDKFMLKKMIGTEALNKFILDYYGIAYGNLAETFNLLDVKSLNQIFNNPEIKEYIFGLSVDVFIKSINAFCEYSNYTWLQCDTFIEKIMNMSYDELYIFMEKTNYKKINLIEKVFDSGDYESCLKLLHFIENKCLNVETLLKYPEYRLMLSDFYPFVYGNEELRRMHNKQEQVKDEFEKKIISLLNENLDNVLLSDGYRIANLDMHSVYVVKYELNGNIMQWEIFTENKNYINMRNAIDKNDIHKAIISKNFKLLSIQKDEFASSLILSSENGLVEGINKVRLKINGVEKQILVNYTGYSDINLSDRFSNVSSIEIIGVQSVESKNVILDDGVGMYEITYVENGILNKTYLTPTHKSLWDEDYVLKIDDYFIENNIVDATDIQIRKVDIQEIDLSSLSISKYSSSYDIFANNKYGGNQSDVRKLVIDFINGTEMNFVSSEKAKCILNLIDKYFSNSSDIDKINLVVAFEQVGCGYIAVANAFCTYMGSLENGFEIFKEKFGFDLYVLENGKKYFNVEAVAFDILCSEFIHQDIKSIINENKIEGVNGLNFVVMMQNYFNDKSIFVKASTGNYIKNKNETKINLLSKNIFPSKSSFKILSASNFDMELMSLGANNFISNDGSLNNTEIVGNVIEGIGGHAMIITDVADDGNLIVSSWNKKYKFISESIDKYIRQGQKSEANVWTIEFDIGE